ncbi:N-succinylarginine dihydrolase [Sphingomonas sp. SUN039]|uniref:N-succinylarginine dihydrolase n=1 Tax=Sphingomonas sp. SUN039 TaxID=2937787 RepID=UPI0021641D73|nr:N-succinylarginine dihydrolase [Sphingomonas sp. SUN039]UVO53418.1 N-succinylarginine dihydrolase [Sphingomonas sp. SUN039]
MTLVEINFDGIVGPSHNYAGLSTGNLASSKNAGAVSRPRAAALQGIEKMRTNLRLGLAQGFFLPQVRPDTNWLQSLGHHDEHGIEPHIRAAAMSASSMWAANAATVSPAPDTHDGRCHLTVANLMTMPHRAHEWQGTHEQLSIAFPGNIFTVHAPVPAPFGDEGAANHMRLCAHHGAPGVEVFVYGVRGGAFPARQHIEASKAVARLHGVANALYVEQSEEAIAAGAFHNDVVAVANERVLFAHEQAFADKATFYAELHRLLPEVEIVEVPASVVSLADAIQSYLFNAQLVTLPQGGGMALILPTEAQANPRVWGWLETLVAGNGPIRRLIPVDVRESMANGGGPACLRLRVVADPATVDARFIVDERKLDMVAGIVAAHWPEAIAPIDLASGALIADIGRARQALVSALGIPI